MNPLQRDRRAVGQRDHRVAFGVVGDREVGVGVDTREADQVDLVRRRVEAVDRVVCDRLGEDQQVGCRRRREMVVGRDCEDR